MDLELSKLSTQQRIRLIQMAEAVLAKEPKNVEALINIGMLLFHEARYKAAIPYLKRSTSLKKKNERVLRVLAESYYITKEYALASRIRRKLYEIKPRNLDYMCEYAESLQVAGKTDLATSIYDKALKQAPENADVCYLVASHFRKLGKYDKVNEMLAKIQIIEPGHPESLYLYCNSRKFSRPEVLEILPHIENAIKITNDKVDFCNLQYAAGKILQDIGDFSSAFDHFKKANDNRISEIDGNMRTPFVNAKMTFTKNYLKERTQFGSSKENMIFILGMPRSGTTLIESLCAAHSDITAGDELIFMTSISKGLGSESSATDQYYKSMNAYSGEDIQKMSNEYLSKTAEIGVNSRYFTDKLPHNFLNVGMIRLLFPKAKIVHCRRHPVDNCLSLYSNSMRSVHIKYKSDLTTLGLYYRQYWQLMQHWRDEVADQFHEVHYEDVVQNTELNARGLIEYLDLEWEERVMDRKGSQKTIKTLSSWQARQPIYKTSAGKWRNYEKQLAPLIDALGPIVEEYESELEALQTQ